MDASSPSVGQGSGKKLARQHLIDPEICIRCNTCEATCPVKAITHDSRNYVVDFNICNACGACLSPCPTGAIDHWHDVPNAQPHTLAEQLGWDVLPAPRQLDGQSGAELPADIRALTEQASQGQGGVACAPASAAKPCINLYSASSPVTATVAGNLRLTGEAASADIRHLVLDFGTASFPVLEGQSIGVLPPGVDGQGRPHFVRLYSIASPRDGERPGHNNLALTIKRVTEDHEGQPVRGVASNYLCDLAVGDTVKIVGPYGSTFLMPDRPDESLLMICTGTGSAPMRAMTERRRRVAPREAGRLMLFFGARAPDELPYFGPLMKLPKEFINVNLALSRVSGQPRQYVQDRIRERGAAVAELLIGEHTCIYICGLKGMEAGVDAAFVEICREHGIDWSATVQRMRLDGRFHVETY
jgi:benzoyl-CoA 2,3-dioxygenase component A